ncbi:hypothetical protein EDC01DRAFT_361359 [Geopyxis carbonaria]|nr:hypothetical protein EDC01DRAFT_361359 [Geopyxis carbonaria]
MLLVLHPSQWDKGGCLGTWDRCEPIRDVGAGRSCCLGPWVTYSYSYIDTCLCTSPNPRNHIATFSAYPFRGVGGDAARRYIPGLGFGLRGIGRFVGPVVFLPDATDGQPARRAPEQNRTEHRTEQNTVGVLARSRIASGVQCMQVRCSASCTWPGLQARRDRIGNAAACGHRPQTAPYVVIWCCAQPERLSTLGWDGVCSAAGDDGM